MINYDIYNVVNSIEDNSTEFYQKLVLGQQIYTSVIYEYLFLNIASDAKKCGDLVHYIPKEDLLCGYLKEIGMSDIWNSKECGIAYKIRKSYVVLGVHYQKVGYDEVFATMKKANADYIDDFLRLSVTNFTNFLDTYVSNTLHKKIIYKVSKAVQYSNKDIVYRASTILSGKMYNALGYSKKNAIEHLAKKIIIDTLSCEKIREIALSQGISIIEKNRFQLDTMEYIEKEEAVSLFADKYGIDHLLMRLALLPRSKMNKHLWDILEVSRPKFIISKESLFTRGLSNFGEELLLLLILDYHLKHNTLNSVDLSSFDIINIYLSPYDIHDQLAQILKVNDFCNYFFEAINIPTSNLLTSKEKISVVKRMLSVFFISNFAPEKKFFQYFNNVLENFYNDNNINLNIDYQFALIKYLSDLNIRTQVNSCELKNGKFQAELIIGKDNHNLTYIYESETIKQAKEKVWFKAYEDIVTSVQRFFFTANEDENKVAVSFFVNRICKVHITTPTFFLNYGFLNANNIGKFDINICNKALLTIKKWVDKNTFNAFINLVYELNKDKFICIENQVYNFGEWIKSNINLQTPKEITINHKISKIYDKIVNPTIELQKKMILFNYKDVNKIYPLSNEIAIYALQQSIDAYNYLPFVDPKIVSYYERLKEEANISDVGTLIQDVGEAVTISILDSNKPLHSQIRSLVSPLKIQRITIACGYCFASGLNLLKDFIEPCLLSNVPFELYIGSLQNYDESNSDNMITGIDKSTINILNNYLAFSNFSLYTCPDRFYHGKIYMFESNDKTLVIIGSSNVSRAAFISNYELNIAFSMNSEDVLHKNFLKWIKQLHYYSKKIENLDVSMFGNNEIKLDGSVLIKRISTTAMKNKICQLTNAEVQYRLNLWMSYSPDIIAEDLGIMSLPNYFVFVYKKYNLIVLESFEAGNSYFCLRTSESFEEIINNLSTLSKTEIFEFSKMSKRGYHVSNKFTLESNIRWYFM